MTKPTSLIFLVALFSIIAVLLVLLYSVNHKGEESKEALVKAYLTDLTNSG